MNVAIVGASGAVGQEFLRVLAERKFPIDELRLFGSSRSAGTTYTFCGKEYTVKELVHGTDDFRGIDIAFTSAGGGTAKEFAEDITRYGAVMIDNSSAFRMDSDVPLVVPECNAADALDRPRGIIANPNCTTIMMVVALQALENISHIRRIHVASYQAASGAGAVAMAELYEQYKQALAGEKIDVQKFAYQLAFNVIPQIDVFTDNGYTKEEMKMYNETKKIMHTDADCSAMCVRVPSLRCHSESIWAETERPVSVEEFREAVRRTQGLTLQDNPAAVGQGLKSPSHLTASTSAASSSVSDSCAASSSVSGSCAAGTPDNHLAAIAAAAAEHPYPMPLFLESCDDVYVGRIRKDLANPNGITFWIVSDQIKKGAALNAVQIAEWLIDNDPTLKR